jgi:spore coat protein U-like protein
MIRLMVWAALALALMAHPAWSQTCNAGATGEAFGTYNPFSSTATTSASTLTVTCQATISVLVSYTIALDGGSAGSVTARSMANGTTRLPYQLYKDILYSQVWGDGTGGSSTVTDGYLLGVVAPVVKTYVAYGSIGAGHQVAPGSYGDLITILLTY